mgnify:CR=1 FL=1
MLGNLFGGAPRTPLKAFPDPATDAPLAASSGEALAVLAGGCFWCIEAVYRELDGVLQVVSGYSGGDAAAAAMEELGEEICHDRRREACGVGVDQKEERLGREQGQIGRAS